MKKLICIFLCILMCLSLCGCYNRTLITRKYRGKEISSLEYMVHDYNGGVKTFKKIDFTACSVLNKTSNSSECEEDYKVIFCFDETKKTELINKLYSSGIFNLKDEYTTNEDGICDGGEWTLTITYSDGSQKISHGEQVWLDKKLEKADIAFFDIVGKEFFGYVPTSYEQPPALEIGISYKIENHYYSNSLVGFAPYRYTWRSATYQADSYKASILKSEHENVTYTVNISIAKMTGNSGNIEGVKLYSYTDDINNKTEISCDYDKQSICMTAEENTSYILVIQYKYGEAEYWFTTVK